MPPPQPAKGPAEFLRQLTLAMDLPFLLIGSTLGGGALGYFLDKRLHTSPLLTLMLGFLGFGVGLGAVLQTLGQPNRRP
ncbi:MAG TPA: AtpZ/AtpI family protein [Candidatus Acidoferrales bacterium]|nr:AtpZ/AtpI family protein [Candidatus Acidoferrales bacterium]